MDLKKEQKGVLIAGLKSCLVCSITLGAAYFLLPQYYEFPHSLPERMAFTIQANFFIILWVIIAVRMVSKGRLHSVADINGSAFSTPSKLLGIKVAFLQNTVEQALIAIGVNLAFATLISGMGLSLIVASVILFTVGRLKFYFGYPNGAPGRAFGMVTTVLPSLFGGIYVLAALVLEIVS